MTIRKVVTQICNGCGKSREIGDAGQDRIGGWREVKDNKHLCPDCIESAIKVP